MERLLPVSTQVHLVLITVSKMSIVLGQCRQSEVQQVNDSANPMTFSDIWTWHFKDTIIFTGNIPGPPGTRLHAHS